MFNSPCTKYIHTVYTFYLYFILDFLAHRVSVCVRHTIIINVEYSTYINTKSPLHSMSTRLLCRIFFQMCRICVEMPIDSDDDSSTFPLERKSLLLPPTSRLSLDRILTRCGRSLLMFSTHQCIQFLGMNGNPQKNLHENGMCCTTTTTTTNFINNLNLKLDNKSLIRFYFENMWNSVARKSRQVGLSIVLFICIQSNVLSTFS